jgi:hypothetical protein
MIMAHMDEYGQKRTVKTNAGRVARKVGYVHTRMNVHVA